MVNFRGVYMTTSNHEESRPSRSKPWGIIIGLIAAGIVAIAVASYVYMTTSIPGNNDGELPTTLDVSGKVNAGPNRIPVSLFFKDVSTGETENVSFEGTHYQIDLPNGNHNWQITVVWFGESNGQCDGGNLAYQRTNITTITHDVSCQN